MRILLDECVDESLRRHFTNYDCQTCRFAGFSGLAHGKLLATAENAGFDVLITVDQNPPQQQNIADRALSIVVLKGHTPNIDDLSPLMPAVLVALQTLMPGQIIRVGAQEVEHGLCQAQRTLVPLGRPFFENRR
jgi:hypothetical protein